ncbi:MAG: inorganic phosphate transporter [Myxococcota bacterium]|nr:inorganic phosphate transporter [Myxococcota bacterium]
MAWSIGANDAANAMGTSVGSKAVSFKEAVIIAAIFEFSGAFLAGAGVTDTMRKGIIDPMLFNSMEFGGEIFALGMLAALMSAAVWIHVAAFLGWPVSTTHSIVGAITGFGIVSLGWDAVQWGKLGFIAMSWVTSPLFGGILSFLVFTAVRKLILDTDDPVKAAKRWSPAFAFPVFLVLSLVLFFKGLKNLYDKKLEVFVLLKDSAGHPSISMDNTEAMIAAVAVGLLAAIAMGVFVSRMELADGSKQNTAEERRSVATSSVEKIFRWLQVITACFVAFAHGSNDVANSIGPLAAIVGLFDLEKMAFIGEVQAKVPVLNWVLLLGGVGIVIGLASYGWRVIETVGTKITEITPSRGFAAEFGAASTILLGSQLGVPLSTTHTIVGAVIGVGFARGVNALNLKIIWSIVKSWILTIPFTAILTILVYFVLKAIFI